jgi:arylsulfate sulfotransferase
MVLLLGCGAGEFTVLAPSVLPVPPTASQSGAVQLAPMYAATGAGGAVVFTPTVTGGGSLVWSVDGVAGGNASVGTVDAEGNYTAPASLLASENVTVTAALAGSPMANYATSVVSLIASGKVSATANPQVASYAIELPAPGSVSVEFGESTAYGFPTSAQATPTANGGQVTVLVAGMLGTTLYHMRAEVTLSDGATFTDSDHTFTTGVPFATAPVAVTAGAGGSPQAGVELFDTAVPSETAPVFATDLQGNVIWTYSFSRPAEDIVQPVRMLPNGHFLVLISYASSLPLQKGGAFLQGALDEIREVDLAGTTIRSVTADQVKQALIAQGYSLALGSLHHDVLALPNGHMVLLFTETKSFTDLPGYPGTTQVLGDALVDVDQNFKPDWVWDSFAHLDVNRHPYLFPDWTHSNALLYSADDHDLLLSVRHQNWILKIDFEDGTGTGNILWRLGEGGDFKLEGGVDPTDWFYAQHGPSYFSSNTTGVFQLGVMDNGDDREFPAGVVCGAGGAAPCLYSTAMLLQVDESNMTATLVNHYVPQGVYSYFGGNVDMLADGDLEADFCSPTEGSMVQELRGPDGAQQVVWQAVTAGTEQYRTERLPSLYPGVTW